MRFSKFLYLGTIAAGLTCANTVQAAEHHAPSSTLYDLTEPFSARHMAEYWSDMTE